MTTKFSPDTGILTATDDKGGFEYNPLTGVLLSSTSQPNTKAIDFRNAGDVWKFDPWTGEPRCVAAIDFDQQGTQLTRQVRDAPGAPSGYEAPRDVSSVTLGPKPDTQRQPKTIKEMVAPYGVMPDLRTRATAAYYLRLAEQTQRERGKTYDPERKGERSAVQVSVAFEAITGKTLSAGEVFLLLQLVKDVRNWNAIKATGHPHEDSSVDAVSYAALKAEALADGGRDV